VDFGLNGISAGNTFAGTATLYRQPPSDLSTIMLLPGSRTWKAEEGCYCVAAFHSNENPPSVPSYTIPVWSVNDDVEGSINNNSDWWVPQMQLCTIPGMTTQYTELAIKEYPIHTSGAVMSGLSDVSTIQMNLNLYFERFVDQNESDLLVLATPSAEYDPVVLECYSHALSLMPPGVTFNENPLGEWFADVIDRVSNVLAFIPHPIAQGLSAAGKLYAGSYKDLAPGPAKKLKMTTPQVARDQSKQYYGQPQFSREVKFRPKAQNGRNIAFNNTQLSNAGKRTYTTKGGKRKKIEGPFPQSTTKSRNKRKKATGKPKKAYTSGRRA